MTETLNNPNATVDPSLELAMTVKIMDHMHAAEVFATPEKSKEFLDKLTFEEFQGFLNQVNGVERHLAHDQRGMHGSGNVMDTNEKVGISVVRYQPPVATVRTELMSEAFYHAQGIKDPKKAGLMLGMVINATHPYADGNGRTSRLVYSLLAHGYDGSREDQIRYTNILENTKGRDVINADPSEYQAADMIAFYGKQTIAEQKGYGEHDVIPDYVYNGYGDASAEGTADDLQVSQDISKAARTKLDRVLRDDPFTVNILMAVLPKEQILAYTKSVDNGKRKFILGNELVAQLAEGQIDDLYAKSVENKAAYVRELMVVFDDSKYAKHMERYVREPSNTAV